MTTFYLGVHRPHWLEQSDVRLFVSRRQLAPRKRLPRARTEWALDSGGFTELSMYGEWRTPRHQFVAEVRRIMAEVGNMAWAAPRDWMCEPHILKLTGLTVAEHQRRTVEDFIALRDMAPDVPWIPVVQGWEPDDYERCWERYEKAGVSLTRCAVVGLGTVCRRQSTSALVEVADRLYGLPLHGFGVKTAGLRLVLDALVSADSMAWSFAGRKRPFAHHANRHKNCANCFDYALAWRQRLLSQRTQGRLDLNLRRVAS